MRILYAFYPLNWDNSCGLSGRFSEPYLGDVTLDLELD